MGISMHIWFWMFFWICMILCFVFILFYQSMKHNYIIICLDSMFETFCVADEFVFSRFRDVFEHSDRPMVEVKIGLEECSWVGLVNFLCHISSCHVSVSIHKHLPFNVSRGSCNFFLQQIYAFSWKQLVLQSMRSWNNHLMHISTGGHLQILEK